MGRGKQLVSGSSNRMWRGGAVLGVALYRLHFSWPDLSDSRFIDCSFYDREGERGCLLRGQIGLVVFP